MISILVSILAGVVAGVLFGWAIRGNRGRARARRGLAVGLPLIVVLGAWAFWRGNFPTTFAPFVIICFVIQIADNDGAKR